MNKRYHRLRERLKHTELMIEHFLDVEKHRAISKKALKQLNKDKPVLGFIFIILYLPTKVMGLISDTIWWNKYRKWCKEVEIIKKEIESYEWRFTKNVY